MSVAISVIACNQPRNRVPLVWWSEVAPLMVWWSMVDTWIAKLNMSSTGYSDQEGNWRSVVIQSGYLDGHNAHNGCTRMTLDSTKQYWTWMKLWNILLTDKLTDLIVNSFHFQYWVCLPTYSQSLSMHKSAHVAWAAKNWLNCQILNPFRQVAQYFWENWLINLISWI